MTTTKSIFALPRAAAASEQDEREIALEYLAEAWTSATAEGIEPDALAQAALFAALATLVRDHGEEAVAAMMAEFPDRVRGGDYTLDRTLQ